MIDACNSQVILKWSKNHPENHYLKIAILLVASASLNNLKIQLRLVSVFCQYYFELSFNVFAILVMILGGAKLTDI